jgi:hypothetical protein
MTSLEARLLEASLNHMRAEMTRHGNTLSSINDSLRILTKVEQSQADIRDRLHQGSEKMEKHENRLAMIEQKLPGLIELRRWVIGGILSGLSMLGLGVVKLLFPGFLS